MKQSAYNWHWESTSETHCVQVKLRVYKGSWVRTSEAESVQGKLSAYNWSWECTSEAKGGQVNVFAQVRLSHIQLGPLIKEEITIWLKSMQRRLRGRMRVRDPWTIVFTPDIPHRIFKVFLEDVRTAVSSFNVSCTETRATDGISCKKLNRLLRDFGRLCDTRKESIGVYFSKGIKVPRGNAKVIASVDKPFVISYLKKKQQVLLRCHYNFTNEYWYTFES